MWLEGYLADSGALEVWVEREGCPRQRHALQRLMVQETLRLMVQEVQGEWFGRVEGLPRRRWWRSARGRRHRQPTPPVIRGRSPSALDQIALISSFSLLSSLKLSDTQVYEPEIRAFLGIASHFYEVVLLKSRIKTACSEWPQALRARPHRLFRVLDVDWHSPESGSL